MLNKAAAEAVKAITKQSKEKAINELVALFHSGIRGYQRDEKIYRIAGNMFFHSLYFPGIYHFKSVLGPENVMVVSAESLSAPVFEPLASISSLWHDKNTLNKKTPLVVLQSIEK